ncbi:hypothetical protein [Pseudanabaena sp. PCC 6802]|uniref:hypothetical protein n=1 Tax=Pseudanabaena sp. PCC 6802 TaxID=118173 RepID=UPI0003472390|nr:hypothetical protein [Pseudanabaena sp. PCC 6802]
MCSNKVIREIASPDRTRKAVVFERDCGATDGGSTQVSILNADAVLPTNKSSNTFVIKYYPKLNVIWQGDHNLIIQHPESTRIFTRETKVNDVSIRYEVQKLEF